MIVCGFALGQFLPDSILPTHTGRLIPSLFLGTALSISSVKIVATIVREMNFMRRDVGQIIVASAIIEDTIGWVIIAVTFGIAGHGSLDLLSLAKTVIGVFLFMAFSFTDAIRQPRDSDPGRGFTFLTLTYPAVYILAEKKSLPEPWHRKLHVDL